MRGSIVKRSRTSWALVVDLGRETDPTTGKSKRKKKWVRFEVPRDKTAREAHKLAEAALAKLLTDMGAGVYVDAGRITLVEWLRTWHAKNVVPHRRPETARVYAQMIKHIATAPLGNMLLQKVQTSDLEAFYGSLKLSPASINVMHAVLTRALRKAAKEKKIIANPAVPMWKTGHGRTRIANSTCGIAGRLTKPARCWTPRKRTMPRLVRSSDCCCIPVADGRRSLG